MLSYLFSFKINSGKNEDGHRGGDPGHPVDRCDEDTSRYVCIPRCSRPDLKIDRLISDAGRVAMNAFRDNRRLIVYYSAFFFIGFFRADTKRCKRYDRYDINIMRNVTRRSYIYYYTYHYMFICFLYTYIHVYSCTYVIEDKMKDWKKYMYINFLWISHLIYRTGNKTQHLEHTNESYFARAIVFSGNYASR